MAGSPFLVRREYLARTGLLVPRQLESVSPEVGTFGMVSQRRPVCQHGRLILQEHESLASPNRATWLVPTRQPHQNLLLSLSVCDRQGEDAGQTCQDTSVVSLCHSSLSRETNLTPVTQSMLWLEQMSPPPPPPPSHTHTTATFTSWVLVWWKAITKYQRPCDLNNRT